MLFNTLVLYQQLVQIREESKQDPVLGLRVYMSVFHGAPPPWEPLFEIQQLRLFSSHQPLPRRVELSRQPRWQPC